MRVLGLDIGTKRIGVALSDEMGWTGMPLETVAVSTDKAHLRRLQAICEAHEVTKIVAGIPINMDGTEGRMTVLVRSMLDEVRAATHLDVEEWDERLTTAAAHRALDEANVHRRKRAAVVDQISASLILQGYLESRSHEHDPRG